MPTPPYAKLLVRVNGGAPTSGGIAVANGDSIQFVYESTAFWDANPPARLEFYAYPSGWTGPGAPWLSRTVSVVVGSQTLTYTAYYYDGSVPPPSFTMPAAPIWGKFLLRLLVNGGLSNGVADPTLLDERLGLEIVSPSLGLHDLARFEDQQFGGAKSWVEHHQANLRAIGAALVAAPSLGSATPQAVGASGSAGTAAAASHEDHVHALTEAVARAALGASAAAVSINSQALTGVADVTFAAGAATPTISQTQAAAGTGVALTVKAQQGAVGSAGGNLVLASGDGGNVGADFSGNVQIDVGDSGGLPGTLQLRAGGFGTFISISYDGATITTLTHQMDDLMVVSQALLQVSVGASTFSVTPTEVNVSSGLNVRLRADATGIGFFSATPVARPAAYTQTYNQTTRTLSAYTPDAESAAYSGVDNSQPGTPYAQVSDLNALRVAVENLRVFTENAVKVLNQAVDDLQSFGLFQ